MIIRNVKVYTEDKRFVDGEIAIQDGRIESVGPSADLVTGDDTILDGEGCYALPGLIDIHFHGCVLSHIYRHLEGNQCHSFSGLDL